MTAHCLPKLKGKARQRQWGWGPLLNHILLCLVFGTRLLAGRWRAVQIWSTNRLNISLLGNALYYALTNHEMTPKCPSGDHLPPPQFTHLSLHFFCSSKWGQYHFLPLSFPVLVIWNGSNHEMNHGYFSFEGQGLL